MSSKCILVSGGAGYIGSHVVKQLLDEGFEVIVFDNFSTGHFEAVDKRASLVIGDIRDKIAVKNVFENNQIHGVMNFAAKIVVPNSVSNPLTYYDDNIISVLTLLRACKKYGVSNFVFSSSAAVYGNCNEDKIDEYHQLNPESPYGFSKYVSENLLRDCERAYGIRHVIFRYFNVAGASKDATVGEAHPIETHLIPVTIKSCMEGTQMKIYGNDFPTRDGTCLRDYIHVVDVARAHVLGMKYLLNGGASQTINLGSEFGYTNLEIVNTVSRVLNKEVNYVFTSRRPGDPASIVASNRKAKSVLGWEARNTLEDMINDDYNFRVKHPRLYGRKKYYLPYGYKSIVKKYVALGNDLPLLENEEVDDKNTIIKIKHNI